MGSLLSYDNHASHISYLITFMRFHRKIPVLRCNTGIFIT